MSYSLYRRIRQKQKGKADSANWFQGIYAIVAVNEDPEHMHRIKVIIPLIDENEVHDEWVRQMGSFAGSGGYGNFDIPKLGSPVILFSALGAGKELFYLCVYNEDNLVSGDFEDDTTRGVRSDGDYKIICRGDLILEGGRILMKSAFGTIQISAAAGLIIDPENDDGEAQP